MTTYELVEELEALAQKNQSVIYAILRRNAGWAIQWYEDVRTGGDNGESNWKSGLVVYRFYDSLQQCLNAEFVRLQKEAEK